jgi:hypothetical protein
LFDVAGEQLLTDERRIQQIVWGLAPSLSVTEAPSDNDSMLVGRRKASARMLTWIDGIRSRGV